MFEHFRRVWRTKSGRYQFWTIIASLILLALIVVKGMQPAQRAISPLVTPLKPLTPQASNKSSYEVLGFAPFWTFDKLDNVNFDVLTTLAYFGVEVDGSGNLDRAGQGYQTFKSRKATDLFKKAHRAGAKVVLAITQMNNGPILALLDDPAAQENAISQIVEEVTKRGIDGVNVDLEYGGDPGWEYRDRFVKFVADLTRKMHEQNPHSQVTVSVYAASVKEPKLYDIGELGGVSDGIFMMAYDFATLSSDSAVPTAPLYGHSSGKYWYDVSTAVDDFLGVLSSDKLILGVPYYGYNYLVYEPSVKAATRPAWSFRGRPQAQTYTAVQDHITGEKPEVYEGWDEEAQVGFKAYYVPESGTWRMVFLDDVRSLSAKYDFAKLKNLKGVGMWALGFDEGRNELWQLLLEKFGVKNLAESNNEI